MFTDGDGNEVSERELTEISRTYGMDPALLMEHLNHTPPPEYMANFDEAMRFQRKLQEHFDTLPGGYAGFNQAISTRPPPKNAAESNAKLAQIVRMLNENGAEHLVEEYVLWYGSGNKRMQGLRPDEPMDDRPTIFDRDPLYWGLSSPSVLQSGSETGEIQGKVETMKGKEGNQEDEKSKL